MNRHDIETVIGRVRIERFNALGERNYLFEQDNLITTAGFALLAQLRIASGTAPSHIAVGTGSVAAAITDTTLGTETARVAATRTQTAAASKYVSTFNAGVATGTLREAGLLNAGAAGTLSNRVVFTNPVTKGATELIVITWIITGTSP